METDFLNFHEEGFSLLETPYQDVLDNKHLENWSETFNIDNEFELDFLSTNHATQEDYQKVMSEWEVFDDVEVSDTEESTGDVKLTDNMLLSDMLDDLSYSEEAPALTFDTDYLKYKSDLNTAITQSLLDKSNLTASVKLEMEDIFEPDESYKLPNELEYVTDNFDLTEYVNGDNKNSIVKQETAEKQTAVRDVVCKKVVAIKQEPHETATKSKVKPMGKRMDFVEKHKSTFCPTDKSDSEEDICIDVETVSENELEPVLEAKDVTSLLEQFEANEISFNQYPAQATPAPAVEVKAAAKSPVKTHNKDILEALPRELIDRIKNSGKRKAIPLIPAIPTTKRNLKTASPSKNKVKMRKMQAPILDFHVQLDHDYCLSLSSNHQHQQQQHAESSACAAAPVNKVHDFEELLCTKKDSGFVSEDVMDDEDSNGAANSEAKRTAQPAKQAKAKIWINKNIFPSVIKNQPIVKNADGKLMVSLLKSNTIVPDAKAAAAADDAHDAADNSSCSKRMKRKLNLAEYKKRRETCFVKSNDNSRTGSPTSNCSSPHMQDRPGKDLETRKLEHQEKLLRMAAELLNTKSSSCVSLKPAANAAAAAQQTVVSVNKQQASPKEVVVNKQQVAPAAAAAEQPKAEQKSPVRAITSNDYEMKTIVSIGVNTVETLGQLKQTFDTKLKEVKPVLDSAMVKISSSSLITSLLENIPKVTNINKQENKKAQQHHHQQQQQHAAEEHGEDKTVIILSKTRVMPTLCDREVQTEFEESDAADGLKADLQNGLNIDLPESRVRRDSSCSSTHSSTSCTRRSRYRKQSSFRRRSLSRQTRSSWSSSSSRMSHYSRSRSRSTSKYSESSYSSSLSRSRSNSPLRWHNDHHTTTRSTSRSSSQSKRFTSEYYRNRNRNSYTRHKESKGNEDRERERIREVEERRVIYVGRILEGTDKADLRRRFQRFGPINKISVHFRDHGDNYGFVTFAYKVDAYAAVEHGNDDPNEIQYDLSFGGRRAFCRTKYSDLDKIDDDTADNLQIFRQEDSFDILLREAQAKLLRNRKV